MHRAKRANSHNAVVRHNRLSSGEQETRNPKDLIDDQQQLLETTKAALADFDSQPVMVSYEAQRWQIYEDMRRLDAEHNELLRQRHDLLALRTRAEVTLEELRQKYPEDLSGQ